MASLPVLLAVAALSPDPLRAQSTWITGFGNWSTDTNWDPVGVPVSDFATQLTFDASSNYTTTNDIGGGTFNLNRITVNNSGGGTVTITGATTANTLTFGGVNPTLDITGTTLFTGLMAGSATITKTGTGTFIHDSNNTGFTGTLIIDQGTFVNRSTAVATTNFNPVSIVVNNGATYQFGAATTGNPNLPNSTYVTVNTGGLVSWQEGEDFGGFHLLGGTINLQQGNANCNGAVPQNWTSGTLTGGTFILAGSAAINKTTADTVFVTGNVAVNTGNGGLNILDGTVSFANAVNLGTANVSLGDATATTGTFAYLGATANRLGNFSINAGNGAIHVDSATTVLTLTGAFSGVGNLNKTGPGKLRLNGALDGTGTITASAGTLQVEPVVAFGSLAVASGAVFAVNSGAGSISLTVPAISIASGTTLQFDLDTNGLATTPLMVVNFPDSLTFTGTPTLRLTNLQSMAIGTYTLVDYNGTPITSGFNLALTGRTIGTLIYDGVNTKIDVAISSTDTVKWAGGVNSDWDVGSAAGVGGTNNWRLVTGGTATNFINTDTITFDDTATRFDVNLTTTVSPFTTVVNAMANYTIGGAGKLSGSMTLNKSGTGALILGTDNDYIGGTNITSGTVQLGNGGTTGSVVGTINLNNGGTLAFNHSDSYSFPNTVVIEGTVGIAQNGSGTVTVANPLVTGTNTVNFGGAGTLVMAANVSGSGILNKNDTGTLTLLSNNNTFTGTLNVNGGTVLLEDLGGGGDLGASSIVLNNGGTFIFGPTGNTDLPDTTLVTINAGGLFRIEQGENYGGFILDGGEFRFVSSGRTGVNSTAIAPFDGATVYDLRSGTITTDFTAGTGGGLNQGGNATTPLFGVLTKTTSGTVTVSGAVTFQAALALQIKEGTLAMEAGNFPGTGATITLGDALTNGTLQVNGAGSPSTVRPFSLASGGGTLNVASGGTLGISGIVSGPGSLTKMGAGTLVLINSNDYLGGTVVASGTLEVNNFTGSGTSSGDVVVAGTLAGDGSIITGLDKDVLINGRFQPGITGATLGTDFSISVGAGGSTVFGGSSLALFDLCSSTGTDQTADPFAADLLVVSGDFEITAGAVLKLTNPNALSFQSGDIFRLFDWTGVGIRTGTWSIDSTDLNLGGLALDTSNLYTTGAIAIVVPEPGSALLAMVGLTTCALLRRRTGGSPRR